MPRLASCIAFVGVLLMTPAWALLLMLAGNGLSERHGSWLFGLVGLYLLALAVAGPWLAGRLQARWQRRLPPGLALASALAATGVAVLLALIAATFLTLLVLVA